MTKELAEQSCDDFLEYLRKNVVMLKKQGVKIKLNDNEIVKALGIIWSVNW